MQIQINTDRNVSGHQDVAERIEDLVLSAIGRFGERITRVEVHISDQNSAAKGGSSDLRCVMEARVAGLRPIVVSNDAPSVDEAADGAARKMQRSLESTLGKQANR
jgi:hypothetical protein